MPLNKLNPTKLWKKYSTAARQNQIIQNLLGFHLSETMIADSCAPNETLEKTKDKNTNFKPVIPDTARSEEPTKEIQPNMHSIGA